jgi:hypothetical protein
MIHYPPLTRLLPLTTVRRQRLMTVDGEVLTSVGSRVEPVSVVARAELPGRYYILNIARDLMVSPQSADKYVRARPGQRVKIGQAVASRRITLGLIPRVVRVPEDGVVAAVGQGRLLLETPGETVQLRAYLPGTVIHVTPNRGVTVETTGALVQGLWGHGEEAFGVLKVLVDQPDKPLPARSIDVACHGAVLVGGSTLDRDALQQALELQVRGIVLGSLDPALLEMARQMPFPIVLTEGLGHIAMASPIFHLLHTNDGREAAISGRMSAPWDDARPEVVIPLPTRASPPEAPPGSPLGVGAQVRVIRGPATGKVGTIQRLPDQLVPVDTGARFEGAIVALDGEEQFVPVLNLEILG